MYTKVTGDAILGRVLQQCPECTISLGPGLIMCPEHGIWLCVRVLGGQDITGLGYCRIPYRYLQEQAERYSSRTKPEVVFVGAHLH
ncbi:hypothetical protein VKT23_020588 [Stygiomarasmius scandens]|uniref:Uncharacterized protein n=1 Tax=Marasmiellus scandens TaxID=2682957 RepID=A0ABR1IL84_9AGAR